MSRIILFIFIGVIAFAIYVAKSAVGKVTGHKSFSNTSFKNETSKVMDKTAKGISWMEQQWDEAKRKANSNDDKNY